MGSRWVIQPSQNDAVEIWEPKQGAIAPCMGYLRFLRPARAEGRSSARFLVLSLSGPRFFSLSSICSKEGYSFVRLFSTALDDVPRGDVFNIRVVKSLEFSRCRFESDPPETTSVHNEKIDPLLQSCCCCSAGPVAGADSALA